MCGLLKQSEMDTSNSDNRKQKEDNFLSLFHSLKTQCYLRMYSKISQIANSTKRVDNHPNSVNDG